jgi:hypothetical protein
MFSLFPVLCVCLFVFALRRLRYRDGVRQHLCAMAATRGGGLLVCVLCWFVAVAQLAESPTVLSLLSDAVTVVDFTLHPGSGE